MSLSISAFFFDYLAVRITFFFHNRKTVLGICVELLETMGRIQLSNGKQLSAVAVYRLTCFPLRKWVEKTIGRIRGIVREASSFSPRNLLLCFWTPLDHHDIDKHSRGHTHFGSPSILLDF